LFFRPSRCGLRSFVEVPVYRAPASPAPGGPRGLQSRWIHPTTKVAIAATHSGGLFSHCRWRHVLAASGWAGAEPPVGCANRRFRRPQCNRDNCLRHARPASVRPLAQHRWWNNLEPPAYCGVFRTARFAGSTPRALRSLDQLWSNAPTCSWVPTCGLAVSHDHGQHLVRSP